jgi:ABC-type oligopeptide transport system ATPase subunit
MLESDRQRLSTDGSDGGLMTSEALLSVINVSKDFRKKVGARGPDEKHTFRAVDDVSLDIFPGETLGLVGESGSGKTTLARCILRTCDVTSGRIHFEGQDITDFDRRQLLRVRCDIQMVFQDSRGALNPKRRVGQIISEPMLIHKVAKGGDLKRRVGELMEMVGLNPDDATRFPSDFSGGQRQRIGLARALGLRPKLLVLDEPVSALDNSIQAQILNLIVDLKEQFKMAYLLIAHDLSVINHISDRVAVMYGGSIAECAPTRALNRLPRHHYTYALYSAERGDAAHVSRIHRNGVSGCHYYSKCPSGKALCQVDRPHLLPVSGDDGHHLVACHFPRTM